ncbi:MAG: DAK2 domain-containing protein [Hungatella hathewayi]|nr:DAK2 domain-containing protein [Hungatella hathewayi]
MNTIDAKTLQKAFLSGAKGLEAKKEWINELNVFPVPDGDTGTNMTLTIMAAAKEVAALEEPTMETLAKAISSGSLRGARGNSGVILSQLFRGFTKEIKTVNVITTTTLANAFVRATETAYKAVMKPKEGTILTVAKGMADKAVELVTETEDIIEFAKLVIEHGDYVLSQTPEMLPILKQAGVVDSGGQGLMQVMKGALDGLLGKEVDLTVEAARPSVRLEGGEAEEFDIHFGYCTEFIINVEKKYDEREEQSFKGYLESIGDSIVVVSDDDVVKVHVHTNDPGLAIQKALTYGSLSRMKIDNMREEHEEKLIKDAEKRAAMEKEKEKEKAALEAQSTKVEEEPKKPYGFIAVSIGEGFGEIFRGIGADYLIEGGQTMNPSTEDMLNAIDKVNAETIYILPNNSNIILAAEQATHLVEDKNIVVIPSKTVPQGITAIINFAPDMTPEENKETMIQEMKHVKTGQITYAVRNTVIDDKEIQEGDIMGIGDKGILTVGKSVEGTALDTLREMVDDDSELISIYYGSDISEAEANEFLEMAQNACPDCEIELHSGGQPIYYYLMSVE